MNQNIFKFSRLGKYVNCIICIHNDSASGKAILSKKTFTCCKRGYLDKTI